MNIRQRVYACFPAPPATVSLQTLNDKLERVYDLASIYGAVRELVKSGHVEPYGRATFRRLEGVCAPADMRGGARVNAGGARIGAGRPRGS